MLRSAHKLRRFHSNRPAMEIEIITLLKVPIKVLSYGGITPSRLVKNPTMKPEEMVLIIPGNPGMVRFYNRFASRIHERTKLAVWVVSHGGHEQLPTPPLKSHPDLYNLQGVMQQKHELIETYLKGIKLRCVGHSIGSKIILELLKGDCAAQIESSYLLFPTIEHMAITDLGQRVIFLMTYLQWLVIAIWAIFKICPQFLLNIIAAVYCYIYSISYGNMPALIDLATEPRCMRKVFHLADDEMKTVLKRDDETIRKNVDKLRFYYGPTDKWTPPKYIEDLKKMVPNARVEVCSKNIPHTFVFNHSIPIADKVSDWICKDRADSRS